MGVWGWGEGGGIEKSLYWVLSACCCDWWERVSGSLQRKWDKEWLKEPRRTKLKDLQERWWRETVERKIFHSDHPILGTTGMLYFLLITSIFHISTPESENIEKYIYIEYKLARNRILSIIRYKYYCSHFTDKETEVLVLGLIRNKLLNF